MIWGSVHVLSLWPSKLDFLLDGCFEDYHSSYVGDSSDGKRYGKDKSQRWCNSDVCWVAFEALRGYLALNRQLGAKVPSTAQDKSVRTWVEVGRAQSITTIYESTTEKTWAEGSVVVRLFAFRKLSSETRTALIRRAPELQTSSIHCHVHLFRIGNQSCIKSIIEPAQTL